MDSEYSNVINKIKELGDSLQDTKENIKENNVLIKKTYSLLQNTKETVTENNVLLKNTVFLLHCIYTILQSRHDLHKRPFFNDPSAGVTRETREKMLSVD